ncbi:ABC transporter ATP-binding protein [Lapillicoccus sp.]|uniref:ABC transporter ATP-binding protein n=1 Tax=Lapillicoccus sp. TaxID=1909287 RepID=UPI0039838EE5
MNAGASDGRVVNDVVLEVEDLVMHFGPVRAVDGVSFRLRRGQVMALVGESGSGKSTVGRCIVRLLEPTAGAVLLGGTDVTHLSRARLRGHRRDVSIVFQDPAGSLNPRMLVGEVVAEPLRLQGRGLSRRDRQARVTEGLARVGLRAEVARRYPHELSGGQRQRVSIARALMSDPTLLIADEPTSALDVSVQASVLNLLADLQRDIGFACLFITHDLSAVEYLADEIAVMYLGQLVEQGTRERVFASPSHPYTQALLSAAPVPDPVQQRARRPVLLGDDIPSAMDPPSGCRFHTRCPVAVQRCADEVPALRRVGAGTVACHLVDDDGSGPDVRVAHPRDTVPGPSPTRRSRSTA